MNTKRSTALAAAAACLSLCAAATPNPIKVLTVTGDWKSQEWYQDQWMAKPGQPDHSLYRGRYIAAQVNAAAPGKFAFTDITNYAGQEYLDADYLAQFDVVLIGDIMGWSLNPRFHDAVEAYVRGGGGLVYCASYKWGCALMRDTPFGHVLPADFPVDGTTGDWKRAKQTTDVEAFKPQVAAPEHPVVKGLDWASVPTLARNMLVLPKTGATTLLKTPSGAPALVAWELEKGRAMITGGIFSNDEMSTEFGKWKDFGKFYAQAFAWLGANSPRQPVSLRAATAEVAVEVDFKRALNRVPPGIFSVHGHDSAGFPISGQAYDTFMALNPRGGFARFDVSMPFKDGGYGDFSQADKQLNEIRRLGLWPIVLFSGLNNGGHRAWADGSAWHKPSDKAIQVVCEEVGALLTHANGRRDDKAYRANVEYIELMNEPDVNYETAPGFGRLVAGVADYVHANFPGVKVGAFGAYEVPYLTPFLDACGGKIDWISRHPYGWTGERVFQIQDEFEAYAARKGWDHIEFIVTEWDFWIQGRQKFDYMMKRYFEAVKREKLLGTLHYRLGMYNEPIYLFGLIWGGWGQDRGAGAPGTPMHDAYDAFWIFRDFRGDRAPVRKTSADAAAVLPHVVADAVRSGDKLNAVVYFDWAYGLAGIPDTARGVNYAKVKAAVKLDFPASKRERKLTISKATGEGFSVVKQDVVVAAGATTYADTIELPPATAVSITLQ